MEASMVSGWLAWALCCPGGNGGALGAGAEHALVRLREWPFCLHVTIFFSCT